MNYQREELIIPIIIVALTLFYFFVKTRSRQFEFIKNTWFKSPTKINKIRFILKMVGLALLMISLLDFRGAEEKIESSIPDQKTIIIIDSSASMLAEDVRPNRYQKSILMARHFIKKAFGHRLAVVLFSDTQKRLVPFTDDLDLLDARVAGLGDVKNYDGGSNVTQAIRESMGYFRVEKGAGRDVGGNILVFTDSEGHDDGIELKLPERVSLAIVGVGTLKGARIPKRDRYNTFRGYKKYEGKEVYTKLNESWLKSLSGKVKTYKYWIANSYSIPTEEVLSFFNKSFDDKINKGSATVKPVKAHFLILPGLVCLIISFFLYPLRAFACLFLVFSFTAPFVSKPLLAQEEAEEEIVLREETKMLIDSHRAGDLSKENKVRLAEELLRDGDFVRSNMLYDELGTGLDYKARNNHAVALLKGKKPAKALGKFSEIQYEVRDRSDVSEQFKKELRDNILLALKEKKKQDEQKKKQDKEDKENKKKKDGEGKGKGSSKKDSKDSKKSKKDSKEKGDKSKDEKKNDKGQKKEGDSGEPKGQKKQKKSLSQKQKEIERKKKMIKVPGLIKQILSDDRNLQRKYIDTSTKKPQGREKKDW